MAGLSDVPFRLPDHDTLYAALVARDETYEGRVFVGVTSTRIFCRLTCPARKPRSKNCRFLPTVSACLQAGFRPCRRCHPLAPAASADPKVRTLLEALKEDPHRRWRAEDVVEMGFDPSTVRRAFKRHFGMTFLDMARLHRIRGGFDRLAEGGRVIDAQLDAGFDSGSGFRASFARVLGQSPSDFTGRERLRAACIDTPLGPMVAVSDEAALQLLEFLDRKALPTELRQLRSKLGGAIGIGRFSSTDQVEAELGRYMRGEEARFETPLGLHGSPFTRSVWQELRRIPPGQTRTYGEVARALGRPSAVRAVARANGANQLAIVIPCHRVIGADGSLTGYGGGLWRKQMLIELEQRLAGPAS